MTNVTPPRRVQFDRHGGPEVFDVVSQELPDTGADEVQVRVIAAGLNPIDAAIAADPQVADAYGVTLPAGNGNDFSGRVVEVGRDVDEFGVGDLVFGGCRMAAQSDYLVAPASEVLPVPDGLGMEQAACLDIAARTAMATVQAMNTQSEDTVLVSAAAGGVGLLTAQLAQRIGAVVVGTASDEHHGVLSDLGILPVTYGEGLLERVRAAAPEGVDVVLDHAGRETLEVAVELGVPAHRVNTLVDGAFAVEHGFSTYGYADGSVDDVRTVASFIAIGEVDVPIAGRYLLDRVREAYERLLEGHVVGKLVLTTEEPTRAEHPEAAT
ncbi:NADP-dependent oxidoreductase [Paramicrobacterium agarici]|uniref:NADP-dependent oxidoreductase n=1 Tax=Paramicrobacterium agarici TaxID=630514 RepID=UPI00114EC54F|nr:NADP-dependent oxidoreductase [Microbacterium agarici]TQO23156.1 NADPH:quinone reductase-like Zn-dependent oxidoreductase [Microbacterium agarici]